MPELPEVETTRRGVDPHLRGRTVTAVTVRESRLREPVPGDLEQLAGRRFTTVGRRAKYLLPALDDGSHLLVHLGMSGSLRLADPAEEWRRHDHLALSLDDDRELRYHDPRRFGLVLWLRDGDPARHPLLAGLGPEPLSDDFDLAHLAAACAGRRVAIKPFIMNHHVVVGVGNIYANEALFRAGIRPGTAAGRLHRPALARLREAIRSVLAEAIEQGGTTLRDFLHSDGSPGYFRQQLDVYGRAGETCHHCGATIRQRVLGQRSTYWCPDCQH